jgi:hypothetical protein
VDRPTESQLYNFPSAEPTSLASSYQLNFVEDVGAAVSITLEVFSFVFRIPEEVLELDIEEE